MWQNLRKIAEYPKCPKSNVEKHIFIMLVASKNHIGETNQPDSI